MSADNKNLKNIKRTATKYTLHITTTLSNTFMNVCIGAGAGDVIYKISCGMAGFKNSKKNAPFAIETLFDKVNDFFKDTVIQELSIVVHGAALLSPAFMSKLDSQKYKVTDISYSLTRAFNGTRKKREKRK